MQKLKIRPATIQDLNQIYELYITVAETAGGILRTKDEISMEYVSQFSDKAQKYGVQLVVIDTDRDQIIGEIHCSKPGPKVLDHVLSELTIVIHPDFQNRGVGRQLFSKLLNIVETSRGDILRVELIARESNLRAIAMYASLGFEVEGKLQNRIKSTTHTFEADVMMAWVNKNYRKL